MMNPSPLCCRSLHNASSIAANSPHNSSNRSLSLKFSLQRNEGARRISGLRAPGSCNAVVVCLASSRHQLGLARNELERTRKQVFEDGYAIFPGMWSKAEMEEVDEFVVGQAQENLLRSFLMDPIDVHSQPWQWLHAPGHRCTDANTSPEPYWHHSWQIAGLEGEDLQRPPWSATLLVSLADRTAKMFSGGVAVFPRSHWIMNDRIANSTSDQVSFPQPCDVPAAAPMELRLECGDMALLHPLLAYTIAPNVSSSSARLLVFKLGDVTVNRVTSRLKSVLSDDFSNIWWSCKPGNSHLLCFREVNYRIDISPSALFLPSHPIPPTQPSTLHPLASNMKCRGEHMWSGWVSMANFLSDQISSVEEMMQLQTEEGKAQLGGWQDTMTGLPTGDESLATSLSTRIAPRDLLAWRLRNSAVQFMQDGQWSNGLSMLLRRAGLRPTCYWTTLQAGRCCMESAPAGQLGGRAGRKCTLEDGERFLLRAIEIAPGWPIAYAELMRCLELMGRGREQEIPGVMEMMKQRCKLEQLCLRYPTDSDVLQESWNNCEAQCQKSLEL